MSSKMFCAKCGWIGQGDELKDAMGYDEMCPSCGAFATDDISWYSDEAYIDTKKQKGW